MLLRPGVAPMLALLLVMGLTPSSLSADPGDEISFDGMEFSELDEAPPLGDESLSDEERAEVQRLFDRGLQYYEFGIYDDALEAFDRAYTISRDPVLLFDIGLCYRHLGNHSQALEAFRAYLTYLPASSLRRDVELLIEESEAIAATPFREGRDMYQDGRYEEALEAFEYAHELSPDPSNWFHLAEVHRRLGNHDQALFLYEAYVRALPDADNRLEAEGFAAASRMLLGLPPGQRRARGPYERTVEDPLVQIAAAERAAQRAVARAELPEKIAGSERAIDPLLPPRPGELDIDPGWETLRTWWFWSAIGALAAGAVTVGIVVHEPPLPRRSLTPIEYQ